MPPGCPAICRHRFARSTPGSPVAREVSAVQSRSDPSSSPPPREASDGAPEQAAKERARPSRVKESAGSRQVARSTWHHRSKHCDGGSTLSAEQKGAS